MIRAGAYVLVGVTVLTEPGMQPVALSIAITAYGLTGVAMLLWEVLRRRLDQATPMPSMATALLPGALAVMAVASGAASVLPHVGPLLALGVIATLDAGSDTSLTAGWAILGAGVLAIEISALIAGGDGVIVLGYPLLLLVGLLAGHNRRAYRVKAEQSAELLSQVEQLRAEQRRVAVLDERTRIAREIHDVLAHSLGALGIQIQAVRALLTDHQDVQRAVDVLAVAQRIATDGLSETRRAVHALRADTLPLEEELSQMVTDHRQRHDTAVELSVEGVPVSLPAESTLALIRTVGESLTNAAKHAGHRPVTVRLQYGSDGVTLSIRNLLGDHAASPAFATVDGGYGLTGMQERLLLLGGTLTAETENGQWVVTARVPR